jgi:sporulation protein YlmC with PRC-barrel domain
VSNVNKALHDGKPITPKLNTKYNMKRNLQILMGACAGSLLALSAIAQDTPGVTHADDGSNPMPGHRMHSMHRANLKDTAKASDVLGMTVKNNQGEKLGKVENMLVDLSSGRIVAIVISSGGFLGMGDELSAVPPTTFRFNPERDGLQLDVSKETLSNAPHFKAGEWPQFNQPGYVGQVYGAYHVTPYFNTNQSADADNTARNVRDRNDNTLTPLDQSNTQADVDITRTIRKQIMADKELSMDAKNVKIITQNGHVTLRGPVNSVEEKHQIGEIANTAAQSENVENQLEVKLTSNN